MHLPWHRPMMVANTFLMKRTIWYWRKEYITEHKLGAWRIKLPHSWYWFLSFHKHKRNRHHERQKSDKKIIYEESLQRKLPWNHQICFSHFQNDCAIFYYMFINRKRCNKKKKNVLWKLNFGDRHLVNVHASPWQ